MIKFLLYFLTSCVVFFVLCSFLLNKPSEKRKLAYSIVDKVANEYEKKYGLEFCGVSEAAPEGKYENLGMEFFIYKKLTRDEGRKMLLEMEKKFLNEINSNEQLKKHLFHHPFNGNNIVINIYSRPKSEPELFYPDYSTFSIFDDVLEYGYRRLKADGKVSALQFDSETKEEALKRINSSSSKGSTAEMY